ncbi:hypothetical protein D9M72_501700 [compost metagenome]
MNPPERLCRHEQCLRAIEIGPVVAKRIEAAAGERCRHRCEEGDLHDQPRRWARPALQMPDDNSGDAQNTDEDGKQLRLLVHFHSRGEAAFLPPLQPASGTLL